MYNINAYEQMNSAPSIFLELFLEHNDARKAQQICEEQGVYVEVSEDLAEWMKDNYDCCLGRLVLRAGKEPARRTQRRKRRKRVVKIVVLANGRTAEEVSWE